MSEEPESHMLELHQSLADQLRPKKSKNAALSAVASVFITMVIVKMISSSKS